MSGWRINLLFTILSALVLSLGGVAKASTLLKVDLSQVSNGSELIFEGRVISKETRLSPVNGKPFTYFTFEIIDVIKGAYKGNTIELGFMGGPKGDLVLTVSDLHMPKLFEKGIYFVESTSRQQVSPLFGWHQGHYLVVADPQTGGEVVIPSLSDSTAITVAPPVSQFKQNVREMIGGAR